MYLFSPTASSLLKKCRLPSPDLILLFLFGLPNFILAPSEIALPLSQGPKMHIKLFSAAAAKKSKKKGPVLRLIQITTPGRAKSRKCLKAGFYPKMHTREGEKAKSCKSLLPAGKGRKVSIDAVADGEF